MKLDSTVYLYPNRGAAGPIGVSRRPCWVPESKTEDVEKCLRETTMSKLIALVLFTVGLGLAIVIPLVGVVMMVASAFGLAIVQEDELKLVAEPATAENQRSNVIPFRRDAA